MTALQDSPHLLKPAEAAKLLGIQVSTCWSWLRSDQLPHLKIGGRYFLRRDALLQWLADQERGGVI